MPVKLGRTSKERNALLRGLASQLLWYGKIETTAVKAKELRSYVEKLITKAVNTYDDNIEFEVTKTDKKGKEIKVTNIKDGAKKLASRRAIMAKTYDLQEIKGFSEKKSEFKARTADVQHPLMDKLFNVRSKFFCFFSGRFNFTVPKKLGRQVSQKGVSFFGRSSQFSGHNINPPVVLMRGRKIQVFE